MPNPLDSLSPREALSAFLNSRYPHGYQARKRCSKCQSATRRAASDEPRRKRESVYRVRAEG